MPARPWVMPSHMAGTPPANWATKPVSVSQQRSESGAEVLDQCGVLRSTGEHDPPSGLGQVVFVDAFNDLLAAVAELLDPTAKGGVVV